jgi:hypothetical protein
VALTMSLPSPLNAEYMEAWAAGFNAAQDVERSDGEAIMRRMAEDFRMSGSELAKRVLAGTVDAADREKIAALRSVW